MSTNPPAFANIPEQTARVAKSACPKGTLAMHLRDALAELSQHEHFAALNPIEGQPAYATWQLTLVTVLQYIENLTDQQAADAARSRIDWKYALGLELTDPGFDPALLPAFRAHLLAKPAQCQLLEQLLQICKQHKWLGRKSRQRTDAIHILTTITSLSPTPNGPEP